MAYNRLTPDGLNVEHYVCFVVAGALLLLVAIANGITHVKVGGVSVGVS
jgi:hypothetical protein